MDNGDRNEGNAALAGPGQEPEGQSDDGLRKDGLEEDGHRQGGEDHRRALRAKGAEEVAEEYEVSSPERKAELITEFRWVGMIPHPDDFAKYPVEVQKKIVSWADDAVAQQDEIVRSAIEMDRAESARLDRAVETDARQIVTAQIGTIVLNLALIIGAIWTGLSGNTAATGFLVGGLTAINVMTLLAPRRDKEGGTSTEKGNDKKK